MDFRPLWVGLPQPRVIVVVPALYQVLPPTDRLREGTGEELEKKCS